jgi:hypothetical protein
MSITETVMRSLDAELVARMDDLAQDKEAYRIQPGWWLRTIRADGTREWAYVVMVLSGKQHGTGLAIVELNAVSPDEPDVLLECPGYAGDPACCLTKAQARKLGLVDPRTKPQDAAGSDPR